MVRAPQRCRPGEKATGSMTDVGVRGKFKECRRVKEEKDKVAHMEEAMLTPFPEQGTRGGILQEDLKVALEEMVEKGKGVGAWREGQQAQLKKIAKSLVKFNEELLSLPHRPEGVR